MENAMPLDETSRVGESKQSSLKSLSRCRTRPDISYPREYAFIAVMSCAQLFTQAGLGMNIAPLHYIGDTFGITNPGQLSWTVAAYSLTVGTFILPAGRIGEIFGYKPVLIAGILWYGLWSLVAGLSSYSRSIVFFDFCRAMQGIGPSFMLPNAIAILGSTYPPGRRKEFIFGLFGATAPSGFNVGAIFAAVLARDVSWEWAYYILTIACCVLAIAATIIVPSVEGDSSHRKDEYNISRLDPWGTVTGVLGLVLFNFSWNQGPVVGWPTPYVYAILIVACACLVAFFLIEARVKYPLVPVSRINVNSCFVLACISAGWASFGIWVYYLWQFLLLLRHQTPLQTAVQFLTCSVAGLIAAVTTGLIMSRVRPSLIMLIAMCGFLVGNILAATTPIHQIFWAQTFVSFAITPWGMDMSFPSATVILSDAMPRNEQGTAASLVNTILNYSISIGLGIAGTIESNIEPAGVDLLRGYRSAWYFAIGVAGLGVCIALLFNVMEHVRSVTKRKEAESEIG